MKQGSKRKREGTLNKGAVPHHIICKMGSFDTKQDSMDTIAAMGAFVGASFDSVSQLNKELEGKEEEMQNSR